MTQSEFKRICVYFAVAFLVLFGFALPARLSAQVVGATISGTVVDPSGAKMVGAEIVITNVGTGISTSTTTMSEGVFGVPNLQPGNYEVKVSATGFTTLIRKGITMTVGQELVLNLTMQVGSASDQVTVTAEAPTVNLANATLSGVIEQKTVAELPLNGRSWTDLAILQPGVHQSQNQPPINAGDRVKRGLGLELTISGARPQQNNYLLDGVNINDYANAGPGSVLGGNLGTDAVAEFSVLTTNYSTEYGRTSGGIVTATTKSGTNQFHGSAYEFIRNDALDAASFIDNANGNPKPAYRRNQYGASAGGPIQKDKTFIFGDYEGVTQALGTTSVSNVLSPDAVAGKLNVPAGSGFFPQNCSAIAGDSTHCQLTVDPGIAKFLATHLIPLPNQAVTPGSNTGQYVFTANQNTQENFFIIRADHTFSAKDRIFSTYLFDRASQSEPDEYQTKLVNNPMFRQMVAIEENHVFSPSLLNSFRVGFNRDNVESPSGATALLPAAADASLGFVPGSTIGNLVIGSDGLAGYSGGLDVAAPFKFHWNSYQVYDNLFYTKGIHSIKFGANVERIQGNTFGADFPGGQLIYNGSGCTPIVNNVPQPDPNATGLSDFLTNRCGDINADVPGTVTGRGVRQTIFGAYFQDDIRLRPNLSINLGMRYEMASIITEESGKLSNLRILSNQRPNTPGYPDYTGSPYIQNPTKKDFEPRVGFAWDPFKDGKTSVAGGFGIFDVLPFPVEMGSGVDGSAPFDVTASATSQATPYSANPVCSSGNAGAYCSALANQSTIYYIMQANPKRNYVMQWNFNIQRQLTPNTTLMVGYVGARGIHMRFQADDNNMVYPSDNGTNNPQGPFTYPLTWPCSNNNYTPTNVTAAQSTTGMPYTISTCQSGPGMGVYNPYMGRTQMALWDGQYWYDGLQVQLNKTLSHSFEVGGAYTYSKNRDTGGGSVASDPFRNSVSSLLWFCKACRRGLSDQDQRHNLTAHYDWNIPTPSNLAKPLKMIIGDWETGGVFTIASGTPFTVLVTGDPLGQGTTDPYQYPDKVPGPACANPVNPQNASNYIKLQCFTAPLISTQLGNSGRNNAIGPGLINLDFSLFKNIPIHEAFKAQFRMEVFNIANRPNFNSPNDNRAVLQANGQVNGSTPGAITLMDTPPREIQFALKFTW